MRFLDTNVILRFLTRDDEQKLRLAWLSFSGFSAVRKKSR